MLSSAGFRDLKIQISDYLAELQPKILPLLKFIIKGSFKRDKDDELYRGRLEYTKELRRFVYNPMVFNEVLVDDALKQQFFTTFGYQENLQFTIYPNSWIRDLALADFIIGKDVYLADGIVLGTNQVSPCQRKIRVGPIKIGEGSIFDQGCKIGFNTTIGQQARISVCCNIGIGCTIGNNVRFAGLASVSHFVKIDDNVVLGEGCLIGSKSIIEDGVILPPYTHILPKSLIRKNGTMAVLA